MRKYLLCLALVTVLSGCDSLLQFLSPPWAGPRDDDGSGTGDIPAVVGADESSLKRFESEQEFQEYFSGQIEVRNDSLAGFIPERGEDEDGTNGDFDAPQADSGETSNEGAGGTQEAPLTSVPPEEATSNDNYSGTTTQEVDVDEADVVKTDGDYIYLIDGDELRIVAVASGAQLTGRGTVKLEGWGQNLYLYGDTVVAITAQYGGYFVEPMPLLDAVDFDVVAEPGFAPEGPDTNELRYERPKTIITVVDVTNRDNPAVTSVTKLEGTEASSRMIDGMLHLVVPNYPQYYFDVFPLLGRPEMVSSNVALEPELMLPRYERVDADGTVTEGELVTWESLYRPEEPDGFGVAVVVSVDIDNNAEFTSVGIVAQPGLIYSSSEALYLTNTDFDYTNVVRETTNIYKFAYENGGITPAAAGAVPGRVLNQYSMGEYQGYLRVATTTGPSFFFDDQEQESVSAVYVLGESDGVLKVVGSVEGIAPRETIQSARFMGDRGYVVTFEQIDPLFTLDLSDPTNPQVVGELKVPGFSTFIVPMDRNHLLTVGQYIPEDGPSRNTGVQLSIFDVTDFANPELEHNVILGEEDGSSSEALWNPKAFTYFAERGLVALPISIYDNSYYDDWSDFEELWDEWVDDVDWEDVDFDDLEDLDPDMFDDLDGFESIEEWLDEFSDLLLDNAVSIEAGVATEAVEDHGDSPSVDGGQDEAAPAQPTEDPEGPVGEEAVEPDMEDSSGETDTEDSPVEPDDQWVDESFDGLVVFEVSAESGFTEIGRISTRIEDNFRWYWPSFTRGVFINDDVFAVTDILIRGATLDSVEQTPEEVLFVDLDAFDKPELPSDDDDLEDFPESEGSDGTETVTVPDRGGE